MKAVEPSIALIFIAGILSVFSPCILPLIPAYFAYMSGIKVENIQNHRKKILLHAFLFSLGFSIIFLIFGAAMGTAGKFLLTYKQTIETIGGIIIILFALEISGLLHIFRNTTLTIAPTARIAAAIRAKFKRASPLKSLLTGGIFALGWSPCYGPILGSILTLAIVEASFKKGIILFGVYALGMTITFILIALLASKTSTLIANTKTLRKFFGPIMALILLFLGITMISGQTWKLANILNNLYTAHSINLF